MSSMCRMFAGLALTTLLGCGDNTTVAACFGDALFCHLSFNPRAIPGPDQTVATGDIVTLDGSNSEPSGGIQSYAWTQTGGPSVTLADANQARASFVAPSVTSDEILSFRLTVVNQTNQADTDTTLVTVRAGGNCRGVDGARAVRRIAAAGYAGRSIDGRMSVGHIDAVARRRRRATRAYGWRRARSRSRKVWMREDPSAFLDASRMLVATNDATPAGVAGAGRNARADAARVARRRSAIRQWATQ